MQMTLLVLVAVLVWPEATANNPIGAVSETARNQDSVGNYNFGYNVHHRDGQQQFRQESRDVLGRVVGSYGLAEPDGRQRVVDYVADHNGFRARVRSNEPGLQGIDSAGVRIVKPEDVPPPLLMPADHRFGHVPYNPGGPPAENPSRFGETGRAFPPLTPDKPYITQSEGLYIPPQAVDDLVYSPSAAGASRPRFGSFQKSPLGFPRSAKLEADQTESPEDQQYDSLFRGVRIEYPSSVFSLPNSEERYGSGKSSHSFRYRVVQIPNGIQAVPEIDPTGSDSPFPSANDIFSDITDRESQRYGPREGDLFASVDQQQRQRPGDRIYSNRGFSSSDQQQRQNSPERPYTRGDAFDHQQRQDNGDRRGNIRDHQRQSTEDSVYQRGNEGFSPHDQQQRQEDPDDRPYSRRPYLRQREYQRPQPRGDNIQTARPEDYLEYGRRISRNA